MGVILACLADVYARRGKANGTDYSIIAEVIVSYTIWKYFRDGSFDCCYLHYIVTFLRFLSLFQCFGLMVFESCAWTKIDCRGRVCIDAVKIIWEVHPQMYQVCSKIASKLNNRNICRLLYGDNYSSKCVNVPIVKIFVATLQHTVNCVQIQEKLWILLI